MFYNIYLYNFFFYISFFCVLCNINLLCFFIILILFIKNITNFLVYICSLILWFILFINQVIKLKTKKEGVFFNLEITKTSLYFSNILEEKRLISYFKSFFFYNSNINLKNLCFFK